MLSNTLAKRNRDRWVYWSKSYYIGESEYTVVFSLLLHRFSWYILLMFSIVLFADADFLLQSRWFWQLSNRHFWKQNHRSYGYIFSSKLTMAQVLQPEFFEYFFFNSPNCSMFNECICFRVHTCLNERYFILSNVWFKM